MTLVVGQQREQEQLPLLHCEDKYRNGFLAAND